MCRTSPTQTDITEHCRQQTLLAGQGAGALMAKTLVQLCSFQQSNFDKPLPPFLHQLKAVWDWPESDRLGGKFATSGLGGRRAISQRLLAPRLGFIRALKRYKQDKITPNREKAGMPHEANQDKSSKVKSLCLCLMPPGMNSALQFYSTNFWWAPKQHKLHSLFTCPQQIHGWCTAHSQEAFQCVAGCRYIFCLPHCCLVPSNHWHSWQSSSPGVSAVRTSDECVFIPDPPPTVEGWAPSHPGEFGGKKGCRMGQGFSPCSELWSTAGLQDCSTKALTHHPTQQPYLRKLPI